MWYITYKNGDIMHFNPNHDPKNGRFAKKQAHHISRINTMYNRSNRWTNRKIEKLDRKGKTAKANVMREMVKENEKARKEQISRINKLEEGKDLWKSKGQAWLDVFFGGQRWMANNKTNMTTLLSRYNEYTTQRGMRWVSNFTRNNTLARMSPKEGYDYLKRKENDLKMKHKGPFRYIEPFIESAAQAAALY